MTRRVVALVAALGLLVACTNSKAAPPPTTRAPLHPIGTSSTVPDTLDAPSTESVPLPGAVPFGTGCSDTSIPFQVTGEVSGWSTIGALWGGRDPESGQQGIVEVHRGAGLPDPQGVAPLTVLGRPATIGTISDGFAVRFTTSDGPAPCNQWALVAHPHTTYDTLQSLAERLTRFGAGEQTISCAAGAGEQVVLNAGDRTIMNLIDLPADRALQTSRQLTDAGQSVLFAKNGLFVHPGVAFDIELPDAFRGLVAMGWVAGSGPVSVVHVPACSPLGDPPLLLAFPGGFYALHPICATVLVREFDEVSSVQLGIGMPCDGQTPVEGPTDT